MNLDKEKLSQISHVPTIEELQDLYRDDKDAYVIAMRSYADSLEERDPHAALKELHRMESGINSIDASFGQTVVDVPYNGPRIELPNIGFNIEKLINGKDTSGFIKLDTGKRRLSLLEPHFILSVGDVITFGAEKYAPNNWRLCEDTSRYKDALLRHIYAYLSGEQRDQETGIEHLAHCACNIMFLQYFDNKEQNEK